MLTSLISKYIQNLAFLLLYPSFFSSFLGPSFLGPSFFSFFFLFFWALLFLSIMSVFFCIPFEFFFFHQNSFIFRFIYLPSSLIFLFIHLFIHSFIKSFVHFSPPSVLPLTHLFFLTYLFVHSFSDFFFIQTIIKSFGRTFVQTCKSFIGSYPATPS